MVYISHRDFINNFSFILNANSKVCCINLHGLKFVQICRSKDFHPAFTELAGIRALVPPNTPLMACTATATPSIRKEVASTLEMIEYVTVCMSPNRTNIKYHARKSQILENSAYMC